MEYEVEDQDFEVLESTITENNYQIVENRTVDDEFDAKIKNQMDDLLREDDYKEDAPQNEEEKKEDDKQGGEEDQEWDQEENEEQEQVEQQQQPAEGEEQQQEEETANFQPTTEELVNLEVKIGKNCTRSQPPFWEKTPKTKRWSRKGVKKP